MKATRVLGVLCLAAALCGVGGGAPGQAKGKGKGFLAAKTFFQTNCAYDPRIGIAADAVVVHRHADPLPSLRRHIESWKKQDFLVGRMFFSDSDAGNVYWKGKWDGKPHPDEVERDSKDEVFQCEGIRPYMLPTEGWIRYLEEMTEQSIEAGADAILPEEPLAHVTTGYEKAFRDQWVRTYGKPWQPESASLEARYLTAKLKGELYLNLETRLASLTKKLARKHRRDIPFVLPIHSLYSNYVSSLVAPLGTSLGGRDFDGYVGQIWTGPVNWALANYDSSGKSFFQSAYVLYDYFVELTAGSKQKLWLLVDPVEDNPEHEWKEFEEWYRHCATAMLFFPETDSYEVMPWPDRVFLPGYKMGGGSPGPENFRVAVLSATQVMQEIPEGGEWVGEKPSEGIGVAVADSLLWERSNHPMLQGVYGLFLPLVEAGVPAAACVMERSGDAKYLSKFRVIAVSFEDWKPVDPAWNEALAAWVEKGGSLLLLGGADDLGSESMWWRKEGHKSPMNHLLARLKIEGDRDGEWTVGKGWVARRSRSSREFAKDAKDYLALVDAALKKTGEGLKTPGSFCMRRGPFVIAHAAQKPLKLEGKFVDVFHPDLAVAEGIDLAPGASGVYRDVTGVLEKRSSKVQVLHCTHRLMSQKEGSGGVLFTVRGPAGTPAVVRVFCGKKSSKGAVGRNAKGEGVKIDVRQEDSTAVLRFPNAPGGVTVEMRAR